MILQTKPNLTLFKSKSLPFKLNIIDTLKSAENVMILQQLIKKPSDVLSTT